MTYDEHYLQTIQKNLKSEANGTQLLQPDTSFTLPSNGKQINMIIHTWVYRYALKTHTIPGS